MPGTLTTRRRNLTIVVAAVVGLFVTGCRNAGPQVVITETPPAAEGGPNKMSSISGRVEGAKPGDSVVLFAKSGLWYVQPFQSDPFTSIRADGTWTSSVHLGAEYAALLVRQGYRPQHTLETLPPLDDMVLAAARVAGAAATEQPHTPTVSFSGYDWTVRERPSDRGGLNQYHPDNVRVAEDGALHLALTKRDNVWTSAEVGIGRTLGYGTYTFTVRDTGELDPAALLTFYTYDENGPADHFREMAIAVQRADDGGRVSGQYVLQPNYVAANVARFTMPTGPVTHSIRWEPGRVVFNTNRGRQPLRTSIEGAEHEFTVGVPSSGKERVRIALCYFRNSPVPPQRNVEVVIERFQHFP